MIAELSVEENLRLGGLWRARRRRDGLGRGLRLFGALRERARASRPARSPAASARCSSLGRALMARPRLLLLDEPSLGLAPRVAAQIMGLLRDLRERTGLTVLLVEQNARSALSVADRGVVLSARPGRRRRRRPTRSPPTTNSATPTWGSEPCSASST